MRIFLNHCLQICINFCSHSLDYNPPVRLANNKLHLYSKVLEGYNKKRKIAQCPALRWEKPVLLTTSEIKEPQFFLGGAGADNSENTDGANTNNNILRKLESQKGEVCSDRLA